MRRHGHTHVAMMRLAWWTCALLALADARIYNRCELARDLTALGVHPDHISTWVCIAYHESRFDTAANNPHSGDHGIFQISELYWCGPGKACGVPCSAFRDDDISDDLECALTVHEEHTRLQGDGFLAWVVYPHHCRHNTKKYLADCDQYPKNATTFQSERPSFNTYQNFYKPNLYTSYPEINNLLPPYLAVSSIFRGSYGKMLDYNKINGVDWYNYKYDKVDELKLPVLSGQPDGPLLSPISTTSSTTTRPTTAATTTTTEYVPPVKPWRFIESNSFRKKVTMLDTTASKSTTKQFYTFPTVKYTISTTSKPPPIESTTHKSWTSVTLADISLKVKSTTASYKSQTTPASTIKPANVTPTAYKWATFTTSYKPRNDELTTKATYKISNDVFKFSTSTLKPRVTTLSPWVWTTTAKPSLTTARYASTTTPKSTTRPWYTFTSRYLTTKQPTTYRIYTTERATRWTDRTTRSTERTATTRRTTTTTTTSRTTNRPTTTTRQATRSPTVYTPTSTEVPIKRTRSTQNIFDLYLNPTKPPKLPNFSFSRSNSRFKLSIFAGGTTTPIPAKA